MDYLNEECKNHPERSASGRCAGCWQFFCSECLVERDNYKYCLDCAIKVPITPSGEPETAPAKKRPRVPQWLMFLLILAMSALLVDIFYLHWGIVGDLTNNQVLYKARSYGGLLGGFKKKSSSNFIVYYHDAAIGESVAQQVEPDFAKICADLLIDPKDVERRGKFLVILARNDAEYMRISDEKTARAGALTDYETKSIIINIERSAATITSTLPHEMVHAVVFEFMNSGNKIPNWLHEGLASYEEARFDDLQVSQRSSEFMADLQQGKSLPVKTMALGESPSDTEIQIYYTQSASIVSFLIDKYGMYNFMSMLKNIQTGQTLDAALSSVYGAEIPNADTLESKWLESIKG